MKTCEKNIKEDDLEDSKIICKEDFILVSKGINNNLKTLIKKVKFLYRSTMMVIKQKIFIPDVMEKQTLLLLLKLQKVKIWRTRVWNSNNQWITDPKVFFSL